jgi:hypothetical protein
MSLHPASNNLNPPYRGQIILLRTDMEIQGSLTQTVYRHIGDATT